MLISFACPISGDKRDNTTVRIVATLVLLIASSAAWIALSFSTQIAAILTALLAIDFITRAFFDPRYSIIAILARGIRSSLNLRQKMVDSAPKVFAARIGVLFNVLITTFFLMNAPVIAISVLAALWICASLEAFFDFCVGCFVYALLPHSVGQILSSKLSF